MQLSRTTIAFVFISLVAAVGLASNLIEPAFAQEATHTKCVAFDAGAVASRIEQAEKPAWGLTLPPGWEPIGASGGGHESVVIACTKVQP
jgi:hypothetical protein